MISVEITTEYITLAQFLKLAGAVMSGGEAKERINAREVTVNGETCVQRGAKLRGGEVVALAGESYEVRSCI